jgi:hypothetical protein
MISFATEVVLLWSCTRLVFHFRPSTGTSRRVRRIVLFKTFRQNVANLLFT